MISELWAEPSLTFTSTCLSQRGRRDGASRAHLVQVGWEGSRLVGQHRRTRRIHLQGACRWWQQSNNVHNCSEILRKAGEAVKRKRWSRTEKHRLTQLHFACCFCLSAFFISLKNHTLFLLTDLFYRRVLFFSPTENFFYQNLFLCSLVESPLILIKLSDTCFFWLP